MEQIHFQEQNKVELLIALYADHFVGALDIEDPEKRKLQLDLITSRILLVKDSSSGKNLFKGVVLEGINSEKLVSHPPDPDFNGFVAESIVVSETRLVPLGVLRLYYSSDFFMQLQEDGKLKLFWLLVSVSLIFIIAWLILSFLLRPLVLLATTLQKSDMNQQILPLLEKWTSDEIRWVYASIRDLLSKLKQERDHLEQRVEQRTHELNCAMESALVANKAKSDFLANISHEIRTPLNGLLGLSQLLNRSRLSDQQRYYVQAMISSGEHLFTLLNDVLDISKIESGKLNLDPTDFLLIPLFSGTMESFIPLADKKGIAISCFMDPTLPLALVGDSLKLRQILFNLIGNAIKFTERGEVDVAVMPDGVDDERGYPLSVTIRDTGIGIMEDKQAYLFSPFMQADPSTTRRYGGSGLGLALSRHLAELMGGTLTFVSVPGKGSSFTLRVRLPVGDVVASTISDMKLPSLSILVVDDEMINRQVIQALLEGDGHHVSIVDNGFVALELLQREAFHVILLDLRMPELDGEEIIKRIRKMEGPVADIPIIILTADVTQEVYVRCMEAGASKVLSKPLQVPRLYQVLSTIVPLFDQHSTQPLCGDMAKTTMQPLCGDMDKTTDLDAGDSLIHCESVRVLQQSMGSNCLLDLLEKFRHQVQETCHELQIAQSRNDGVSIQNLAHGLQGVAAFLGLTRLTDLAEEIECIVAQHTDVTRHDELTELIAQLVDLLSDSCAEVRQVMMSEAPHVAEGTTPRQVICHSTPTCH
ncbi:MAG: response regulator [Magnetococcales bacterium]|nr:response regulator [Magnetococcales bacterium]